MGTASAEVARRSSAKVPEVAKLAMVDFMIHRTDRAA
jgi:hypothetical protein